MTQASRVGNHVFSQGQLSDSARLWQEKAFESYLSDEDATTLAFAAFALEHVHKAYLCSKNPALLVDIKNGKVDSLYHLLGVQPTQKPRTIGANEALTRARALIPHCRPGVPDSLQEIINIRDGVVHAGQAGTTQSRDLFAAFVQAADEVWAALGVDHSDRWGRNADLARTLSSQVGSEVEREIAIRLASAALSYWQRFQAIPESEHDSVKAALRLGEASSVLSGRGRAVGRLLLTRSMRHEFGLCPVCRDDEASYVGSVEITWEQDFADDDTEQVQPIGMIGFSSFRAEEFECGICGLYLEDSDQIEAAGVASQWDLYDSPDPAEFGFGPFDD